MPLPLKLDWDLAQNRWASQLNPLLADPLNRSTLLSDLKLINGVNVINHKLGRLPQGWFVCDVNGAAEIYRSAPFNDLTLTLTSNAAVTINLAVF